MNEVCSRMSACLAFVEAAPRRACLLVFASVLQPLAAYGFRVQESRADAPSDKLS